jgi:hypothetical protein
MSFKQYITESANINNSKDKIIKATVRRYKDNSILRISIDGVTNKGYHFKVDAKLDSEIIKVVMDMVKRDKTRIIRDNWN